MADEKKTDANFDPPAYEIEGKLVLEVYNAEPPAKSEREGEKRLPRVNFRPFLFCALGLALGIFLYTKIRFGGLSASDFLFLGVFLFFAVRPLTKKRMIAIALCLFISAGVGVTAVHLYSENFDSAVNTGEYDVTGTVQTFSLSDAGATAILTNLHIDGERKGGKMQVSLNTEHVRAGDVVTFHATVRRNDLPTNGNTVSVYFFVNDVRYTATAEYEKTGTSANVFLLLNSAIYDSLHANLNRDAADVGYALLTGNSRGMDGSLLNAIREGGIAHIFAVSGLHIGILFGAVSLLFAPLLKRKSFIPALALAICYSALCSFTVSSVRAVMMCAVLSLNRALGRKTDLLSSLSLAAVLVLMFLPAQWLSAGFRLSFGACLGLALFSGTFSRAFRKLPRWLGGYLAASFSVQIFTFPVLLESFGYVSVWGTLLNLILIPLLPVLFLGLLLCTLLALMIPPAAGFFLAFPGGMISLLLLVFAAADFSMVITGFSLGAGLVVWLVAMLLLSERLRLKLLLRGLAAGALCVLFTVCVMVENVVFSGCKITVYEGRSSGAVLLQTPDSAVLVIDGMTLGACEDFLARNYGGKLDAVIVLSDSVLSGINVGAFLNTDVVYAREEIPTGLHITNVVFAERFEVGGLTFRYEDDSKLVMLAEGRAVEFDFERGESLGADLFVGEGSGGLKFWLDRGIMKTV